MQNSKNQNIYRNFSPKFRIDDNSRLVCANVISKLDHAKLGFTFNSKIEGYPAQDFEKHISKFSLFSKIFYQKYLLTMISHKVRI